MVASRRQRDYPYFYQNQNRTETTEIVIAQNRNLGLFVLRHDISLNEILRESDHVQNGVSKVMCGNITEVDGVFAVNANGCELVRDAVATAVFWTTTNIIVFIVVILCICILVLGIAVHEIKTRCKDKILRTKNKSEIPQCSDEDSDAVQPNNFAESDDDEAAP